MKRSFILIALCAVTSLGRAEIRPLGSNWTIDVPAEWTFFESSSGGLSVFTYTPDREDTVTEKGAFFMDFERGTGGGPELCRGISIAFGYEDDQNIIVDGFKERKVELFGRELVCRTYDRAGKGGVRLQGVVATTTYVFPKEKGMFHPPILIGLIAADDAEFENLIAALGTIRLKKAGEPSATDNPDGAQ